MEQCRYEVSMKNIIIRKLIHELNDDYEKTGLSRTVELEGVVVMRKLL